MGALLIVSQRHAATPLPPPVTSLASSASSGKMIQAAADVPRGVARRETAAALPAAMLPPVDSGARPVSRAIAAAFPGLSEVSQDWREFRPDTLTVAPHPDLPLTFTRIAVKDEGKYVTWIGRNTQMPGASFVGVATADGYDAILVVPGASQFSYHVRGDEVVIEEAAPGEESCGVEPVQQAKPPPEAGSSVLEIRYANGFDPDAGISAATAALTVDVLFVYDATTLAAAAAKTGDPTGYIDAQCKAMIETSNVALSQSGVTAFVWRYLGVVAAPAYVRTGDLKDDLGALAPGGPLADWVKTTRYQRGADQIMLLVGSSGEFAGRAYSNKQTAITRDYAIASMLWTSSSRTMAHELAHNFGCNHDRAHVDVKSSGEYGPPAPDYDGFWCYGQMWQNQPPPGYTANLGTGGTIMSYADWSIPYFSNPNITVHLTGALFGWSGWGAIPVLGTQQLGQPETAPAAAYNARVLSDQAAAMSNIDEEIGVPAIVQQPRTSSVPRGQSFTLGVTATGGGLSYQWLKNGVAISGAQGSSYSKVADASEPDGYSVTVSNLAGSVTSDVVTITVTTPPSGGGNGSSSGGGGGALNAWASGVLCALGLARWGLARVCPKRCS